MAQKHTATVGIIGGSGLYEMEGIKDVRELKVKTPFGEPSDAITLGTLEGVACAFLPRHGKGHKILPTELNARANIYALKSLGVEQVLSISACGSLREEFRPRDLVFPDQLYDRTKQRIQTFFGQGVVAHVGFAEPYCKELLHLLHTTALGLGARSHEGGVYVCIEGPEFSTKAESEVNRRLGFSIVGMTALPEARLAREAELCYSTVGLVTDYDVWKEGEEVTVDKVVENLMANVNLAKQLIRKAVPQLNKRKRNCACSSALKYAIFTQPKAINKQTAKKLSLLVGKYLK